MIDTNAQYSAAFLVVATFQNIGKTFMPVQCSTCYIPIADFHQNRIHGKHRCMEGLCPTIPSTALFVGAGLVKPVAEIFLIARFPWLSVSSPRSCCVDSASTTALLSVPMRTSARSCGALVVPLGHSARAAFQCTDAVDLTTHLCDSSKRARLRRQTRSGSGVRLISLTVCSPFLGFLKKERYGSVYTSDGGDPKPLVHSSTPWLPARANDHDLVDESATAKRIVACLEAPIGCPQNIRASSHSWELRRIITASSMNLQVSDVRGVCRQGGRMSRRRQPVRDSAWCMMSMLFGGVPQDPLLRRRISSFWELFMHVWHNASNVGTELCNCENARPVHDCFGHLRIFSWLMRLPPRNAFPAPAVDAQHGLKGHMHQGQTNDAN
ncbi:hypothetical protein HII31_02074, partial [Pseudocercospora fuligena]